MDPQKQADTPSQINLKNPAVVPDNLPPVNPDVLTAPAPKQAPQPEAKPANPNSTQNSLKIAEIRDGIAIMNDGSFRAVIMFKSINFDLMSPSERDGVEYAYQSFLNSLYFPVQIFVRSEKIDMAQYIEKLDKMRKEQDNMLLSVLMEDYIQFIDDLAAQTNIMEKNFYVVIPFFNNEAAMARRKKSVASDSKNMLSGLFGSFYNTQTKVVIDEQKLEEAKTELRKRVELVMSGLGDCGVKGLPLDTQELIELYYNTYNPDTATHQKLRDFSELSADWVEKGEGFAPQPQLDRALEQ